MTRTPRWRALASSEGYRVLAPGVPARNIAGQLVASCSVAAVLHIVPVTTLAGVSRIEACF